MPAIAIPKARSSTVAEVGYDLMTCELTLVFRSSPRKRYRYKGVTPRHVARVLFAGSIGSSARSVITIPWGKNFTVEAVGEPSE